MIFNSQNSKPTLDGAFIEKFFDKYEKFKHTSENVGWKIIESTVLANLYQTSRNLDIEQYKRIRFLNKR